MFHVNIKSCEHCNVLRRDLQPPSHQPLILLHLVILKLWKTKNYPLPDQRLRRNWTHTFNANFENLKVSFWYSLCLSRIPVSFISNLKQRGCVLEIALRGGQWGQGWGDYQSTPDNILQTQIFKCRGWCTTRVLWSHSSIITDNTLLFIRNIIWL